MVISPRSHSNRHFHVAQVQLQHLCHRYFNSHSSQLQLQGIHLNHPRDTDASNQVILPGQQSQVASKGQQQSRGQPTSFIVQQQARPSRPLTFTLHQLPQLQAKKANATYQNFQASSEIFCLWWTTNRLTHCNRFYSGHTSTSHLSSNHHRLTARTSAASSPVFTSSRVSRHQTAVAVQHLPSLQSVLFRTTAVNHLKVLFSTTRIFPKQLIRCCSKTKPKQAALHRPTHFGLKHIKNEWMHEWMCAWRKVRSFKKNFKLKKNNFEKKT